MSFGWTAATWMAVSAAATTAVAVYQGEKNRTAQNHALDQAKADAKARQQAADEAQNRANAKTPDVAAMLGAAALASRSGQAGTLLTGPQGINTGSLTLGKTTLLGGGG